MASLVAILFQVCGMSLSGTGRVLIEFIKKIFSVLPRDLISGISDERRMGFPGDGYLHCAITLLKQGNRILIFT